MIKTPEYLHRVTLDPVVCVWFWGAYVVRVVVRLHPASRQRSRCPDGECIPAITPKCRQDERHCRPCPALPRKRASRRDICPLWRRSLREHLATLEMASTGGEGTERGMHVSTCWPGRLGPVFWRLLGRPGRRRLLQRGSALAGEIWRRLFFSPSSCRGISFLVWGVRTV